jgi:hypothetical protein
MCIKGVWSLGEISIAISDLLRFSFVVVSHMLYFSIPRRIHHLTSIHKHHLSAIEYILAVT